MIEDLRPLSGDAGVPIPNRIMVGSMTSTAGGRKQLRWLANERPLADRIDADLARLLRDAGFPIPTDPDPRSPPSLLDVQIVELWVTDGAAVDSGGMAAVTLVVAVGDPATGQRLWRHRFSAEETAPPPPHSAAMLEKTLNAAYCRALDAMAGAFRTPEFATAVARQPL